MLALNVVNSGETTTLKCRGRIVAGDEVSRLKSAVLCHQDAKTLVLDLAQVETMDGAGMGLLAFLAGWTRVVGIRLKIANPSHHVRELLELTNLDTVLDLGSAEMTSSSFEQHSAGPSPRIAAHP
ncbi:MAG TPA: STAS domain-containing protein [Terriglobales bacterium]|jgi:anti-anti-sigma factor